MGLPGTSWPTPTVAKALSTITAAMLVALLWSLQACGSITDDGPTTARATASATASSTGPAGEVPDVDPVSGLPYVPLAELPPEAADTVALIDAGGPFPYERDGTTFRNLEDLLPDHPEGYYKEYTVETPGSPDRGARRVVAGAQGELYWTEDHYESFERIWR